MSTVQKLPAYTLLDVTVSSPAEMIAAIKQAEAPAVPPASLKPVPRAWQIWKLPEGTYRLIMWGKPAGTHPTRYDAEAIRDRLLAAKARKEAAQ